MVTSISLHLKVLLNVLECMKDELLDDSYQSCILHTRILHVECPIIDYWTLIENISLNDVLLISERFKKPEHKIDIYSPFLKLNERKVIKCNIYPCQDHELREVRGTVIKFSGRIRRDALSILQKEVWGYKNDRQ